MVQSKNNFRQSTTVSVFRIESKSNLWQYDWIYCWTPWNSSLKLLSSSCCCFTSRCWVLVTGGEGVLTYRGWLSLSTTTLVVSTVNEYNSHFIASNQTANASLGWAKSRTNRPGRLNGEERADRCLATAYRTRSALLGAPWKQSTRTRACHAHQQVGNAGNMTTHTHLYTYIYIKASRQAQTR